MNRIQTIFASIGLGVMLAASPFAASAQTTANAHVKTGIVIDPSGFVRIIGADVTAVGNGVIDAAAQLGGIVFNLVADTSATTKIGAQGSLNASSSAIAVGDKVNIVGSLSASTGSTLNVVAKKIRDITSFPFQKMKHASTTVSGSVKASDNDHDADGHADAHSNASVNAPAQGLKLFGGLHLGLDN